MFLLDTDVLSALRRPERAPNVEAWIGRQNSVALFVSVITIGEIERGMERQQRLDPIFAEHLTAWIESLLIAFADRILPFDLPSARRWGRISAAVGNNNPDLQIAAAALEHGLTVVTRNVSHFAPAGVATVDPFAA